MGVLLFATLVGPAADAAAPASPIRLVFRFDDYSTHSDTSLEREVIRAFQERGLRLTLGVVPKIAAASAFDPSPQEGLPLPPDKLELLRQALASRTVEVALHGLSHQTVRVKIGERFLPPFGRYHSEFVGVRPEVQRRKIEEGRRFLESELSIRVETFIPPWNGYDENTLRVLEELGFTVISAAGRGPLLPSSRLRFLPRTCDLWVVPQAVEEARRGRDPTPVILALFHHYDFRENNADGGRFTLPELRNLLDWVVSQEDLRVQTIGEAAHSVPDLGARRFYWNRNALLWQITPPWVDSFFGVSARAVYLGVPAARRAKIIVWAAVLVFYLGLTLSGGLVARGAALLLFRRFPFLARIAPAAAFLALVAILLYSLRDLEPYWYGMAAASWMAGAWVGLWLCRPPRRT